MTDDLIALSIEELEGEIMLAAFHGYRLPAHEKRLLELLARENFYDHE